MGIDTKIMFVGRFYPKLWSKRLKRGVKRGVGGEKMKISKKEKKHFHYSSRGCCGENFRSVSFLVWSGRKSEHEHEHEDPQKNRHTTENRNHPGMFCIHICLVPLKIGITLGR